MYTILNLLEPFVNSIIDFFTNGFNSLLLALTEFFANFM